MTIKKQENNTYGITPSAGAGEAFGGSNGAFPVWGELSPGCQQGDHKRTESSTGLKALKEKTDDAHAQWKNAQTHGL